MKIHSSTAFVIGGTRGLGRVVARLLAQSGMKVLVLGAHAPHPSDARRDRITFLQADLGDRRAARGALRDMVCMGGRPNYVVFAQRYRGSEEESWAGEMDLMLSVPRDILRWLGGCFAARGDRGVVFVSSVAGRFVIPEQDDAYHTTRAALGGMMRWQAVQLAAKGVRVNMVLPGAFIREIPGGKKFTHPAASAYGDFVPLGRMATALDVARVVRFLCSGDAGFVTGQEIVVDGGVSILGQEALAAAGRTKRRTARS